MLFPKRQLLKSILAAVFGPPSLPVSFPITACGALKKVLPNLWEVTALEIAHYLGSCHFGIVTREVALGKKPNTFFGGKFCNFPFNFSKPTKCSGRKGVNSQKCKLGELLFQLKSFSCHFLFYIFKVLSVYF